MACQDPAVVLQLTEASFVQGPGSSTHCTVHELLTIVAPPPGSWTLESDNVLPDVVTHPTVNHSTSAFFEPSVIYNRDTQVACVHITLPAVL